MSDVLVLLNRGEVAGELHQVRGGTRPTVRLTYAADYRSRADSTPLSTSMPLSVESHSDSVVTPWLANLLPDDPEVLRRWARQFDARAHSPFSLLSTPVGEDCAGAFTFVTPGRIDAVQGMTGAVHWLDDGQVARLLRDLDTDRTAWLGTDFAGRFSLAGAQAKTALLHRDGQWGIPSGSVPTTHILKPAIAGFVDHDLNEHLCLVVARAVGLPSAHTSIMTFEDQKALVVQRYDRLSTSGSEVVRIHQEDMCQALSIPPDRKYQADGGPGAPDLATALRRRIAEPQAIAAVNIFANALIFNWVIGGTDAHAKNYSILLSGNQVRLAPLYDIESALPYDTHIRNLRLAMTFAGDYERLPRSRNCWERLSGEVGLPADSLHDQAATLIEAIPQAFADAAADPAVKQLGSDLPARLVDAVAARARECADAL